MKKPRYISHEKHTFFILIGIYSVERMAIDSSTGNLYFTAITQAQSSPGYIGVVHRQLALHKTLISGLQSPRAIALYASKGWVDRIVL